VIHQLAYLFGCHDITHGAFRNFVYPSLVRIGTSSLQPHYSQSNLYVILRDDNDMNPSVILTNVTVAERNSPAADASANQLAQKSPTRQAAAAARIPRAQAQTVSS
jgi:hypothetical protein